MMQLAPILLLLALSLSWPRFATTFRPGMESGLTQSPLTMAAGAVSVSCLGLAVMDQGALAGALLIGTAVLVSYLLPRRLTLLAVAMSCVCFTAYLQIAERAG
jgi:hypothetical protein